jgi:hypothetical protein
MGAPVIKHGSVASITSGYNVALEFRPGAGTRWKSTMLCWFMIVPQPNTVGGGAGQSFGLAYLQLNGQTIAEFRLLETFYRTAGAACVVIPFGCGEGDGITFSASDVLRWIVDDTVGTSNSLRASATFFGEKI